MQSQRTRCMWALLVAIAITLCHQTHSVAQTPNKAVAYGDVKNLVQAGLDEAIIHNVLEKSPTTFTLDAEQERELRSLGASDNLISELKGNRSGGTPVRELSDLAIVLDCSGSMAEQTSGGQLKMDVAKTVVTDLIERIPNSLYVTFIVYGHDKRLGCRAVSVARPLASLGSEGKSGLRSYIAMLQPASKTPIALSLDAARRELAKRDAKCGLILISDGKETCGGDPQAEARRLVKELDCTFGVNVVAFDVDEEGTQQLREVAEQGHGRFSEASNTTELKKAIDELVEEVEERAEEPLITRKKSLTSALEVKPWNLRGFPKLQEIKVFKKGNIYSPNTTGDHAIVQKITDFSKAVPLEAGSYELWYKAEGASYQVKFGEVEIPAMTKVTLNGNRIASAIKVPKPDLEGFGELETLWVSTTGTSYPTNPGYWIQMDKQFDAPLMVAPNVEYDVYIRFKGSSGTPLARKISVSGGEMHVIGE